MSRNTPDSWEKPRSHGMKLSKQECEFIAEGYRAGRDPRDVARDLKCSTRTVYTHFALLRGCPPVRAPAHNHNPTAPAEAGAARPWALLQIGLRAVMSDKQPEARTEIVKITFTREEQALVNAMRLAANREVSMSIFCRSIILDVVRDDQVAHAEEAAE